MHPPYEGHRDHYDPDEQLLKGVRVKTLTFNGHSGPKAFLDWLTDMNHYFEWYDMSDARRVQFTKMKLMGQAKRFWATVEREREVEGTPNSPLGRNEINS